MKRLCLAPAAFFLAALSLIAAEPAADLRLRPDAEGFIRDWLMFAPIPLEEGATTSEPVTTQQLKGEASLQPRIGQFGTAVDGVERMWRVIRAPEFYFDFNAVFGEVVQYSAGYMVAYVVCEQELKDLTLLAGGNDQYRVYLNSKEVVKHAEAGPLQKDAEQTEGVTLRQGVNTVVFKVVNEQNNWQGCLRFIDKSGKPVTAFSVKLSP